MNNNNEMIEKLPDSSVEINSTLIDKLLIQLFISSEDLLNIRDSWNIMGGKISQEYLQYYNNIGNLLILPALKQRTWTVT